MTKKQFLTAVMSLDRQGTLSDCDTRMLATMLRLARTPEHPRRYAREMGWKAERGTAAHSHFGRLAHRVCEESLSAREYREDWVLMLFKMVPDDRTQQTLWQVKSQIQAALTQHKELTARWGKRRGDGARSRARIGNRPL